ncbi:hypothetical protein [Bacillus sp. 165]|uniref:hypothetical protein n=1 Tax=Bacillus sp. 165 TaxID=1529117 RepID=UPI001ADD4839|nr:hypothetical protein [Bacillus sp. 165]MBO9129496.1 hypothetical protein [Bacillus sp. 165]
MSLFINNNDHPDVYKNDKKLDTSNQGMVRHNALLELIQEQQTANMRLAQSLAELKEHYKQLEEAQSVQWKNVNSQMNDLTTSNRHREKLDIEMLQRLNILDEKHTNLHTILENEAALKQSIIDEMSSLHESSQSIASRLDKNEAANEQLYGQLNEQLTLQKEVVERLSKQEEFQEQVLTRLDTQEALTEKISRQLNHIRSIIFERANYLATKLEDGYKLTSSYVYKLMTGSEKPLTFTSINDKRKKKQEHSDG